MCELSIFGSLAKFSFTSNLTVFRYRKLRQADGRQGQKNEYDKFKIDD
jgi:hypothetical protein